MRAQTGAQNAGLSGDSQRLLDHQLAFRDAELKDNPEFSGVPRSVYSGHRVGLTRIITHLKQLIHEPIFSTFRRLVGNPHREDIQKDVFACKRLRNVYIYQKQISE